MIWIGTQSGLDMYDKETDSFTHYRNEPDNPNSLSYDGFNHALHTICEDASGNIWVGAQVGRRSPKFGQCV